ncbi:MAG: phosphoribosyltransferase family protein [Desulfobacterales bacterium]|nr:phosphoribosyltransferase family protein [Desulfobacterales bacterium]
MKRSTGHNRGFRRVCRAFTDALFPAKCLVCSRFFHPQIPQAADFPPKGRYDLSVITGAKAGAFQESMSLFLCPACSHGFQPVESPMCSTCGRMFNSREGRDHVCQQCLEQPGRFGKARAYGIYDRALMQVIHCYKYKGDLQLAAPLGWLLFSEFVRHWSGQEIDLIVPVPLHIRRFRKRGFNQAYLLIADWVKKAAACEVKLPDFQIAPDLLFRSKHTDPQTFLSRKRRMENIRNAFALNRRADVKGKRLLVVDDVYTTGATVDECIKVLCRHGAANVDVLTLAQAQ